MTDTLRQSIPPRTTGDTSLEGKIALLFGAGTAADGWSNGGAAALTYARAGATVICGDIDAAAANRTVDAITADGGKATALQVDVTAEDSVAAAVATVIDQHHRLDIAHNNVGVTKMGDPVSLSTEDWRRALDINLTGVFHSCKYVLPHMRQAQAGVIINISSLAAIRHTGLPYSSYYAAKAAVNHLTSTLAVDEAAHGIRINAIMPGLIDTPLIYRQIAGQYADADEMVAARNAIAPIGRMGTVWELANAARFLASDDASYITGVCLAVDGGLGTRCMA
ncbi:MULTISPECIES: SDR family NAD(P)-dependent oxidoreductase [Rhodococcus]|uniref:SDR family NAD(P)-dependent oxidoreductase n=1 Tax=Rhodococcus oxybenzonivorans TaxID=1990687 RepID=A0AAE4UY44_9NOCA|nr:MULTISPECIES: SDR family NAD(P)-dependent oxidoreductase [Rhodococcus]MDV7241683.1 SDR family NAD(P)-dependent oxidoreductase [Rhodococcus oxybenzonivorans]MDV7264706.1 SDR family NAD(P)-dependent oxidoreductase [Rhodococcus oxybenzonivorans]MDV7273783.1 SDR family NAD(P)-dependent oxidoreductase [Rhodococcus oxybenzonivorans]MDV7333965.1 SDR family NAD(P)-dependent oxidoreductase [Rhodococcus oxybenzonivorans]MDV7343384.1 SDR family NAD(P)-dependent oxidoreductase [Rhodococcus oxybenzonivo